MIINLLIHNPLMSLSTKSYSNYYIPTRIFLSIAFIFTAVLIRFNPFINCWLISRSLLCHQQYTGTIVIMIFQMVDVMAKTLFSSLRKYYRHLVNEIISSHVPSKSQYWKILAGPPLQLCFLPASLKPGINSIFTSMTTRVSLQL